MGGAIAVEGVSKSYRRYRKRHQSLKEIIAQRSRGDWEEFWALRDISFEVEHGQFLGIIGHNGSGKSTLLKLLTGIMPPSQGEIRVQGRVASLLELGAGFQPEYTGRENIYLYGTLLGMRRKEIDRYYDSIVEFCELGEFMEMAVKNYSSGMYVRLGFAVAVHLDPQVLLIDEVLAVGDANFQKKCFQHLFKLRKRGCTIVLVTHDTASVEKFCEHSIWIDHGRAMAQGKSSQVVQQYLDAVAGGASIEQAAKSVKERVAERDLTIKGLRFLDKDGRQVLMFDTGAKLRIEIDFHARRPLTRLEVGLTVFREDDLRCLDLNLYGISVDAGSGRWVVDADRVDLQGGRYAVTLAVFDRNLQRFQAFQDRQYPFTVHDDYSAGGAFYTPHRWSLATPDGLLPLVSRPPDLQELHGMVEPAQAAGEVSR
ncbi:MAG: ABC transporter ATP-binding protein [Candidatus Dormibacteraeota bacterium]|uniref:ABC transporter ATP-binding protein n=1 Tax=Candidatus Dormiibacter inghamiae TaxID=3127013 RepID=A0A934ND08_9BACT|nr:ABC transporter ATP-binding protein [Candidatus Dormibacteraeota bacterium]MBJ7605072.1 ABC transporter ATP-binding protein [Candidatus Dormibacteraeota bacterium]